MMAQAPIEVETAVRTDNTAVKSTAGRVYWVIVAAAATGGVWALESDGAEKLKGVAQANSNTLIGPLIPPARFSADITPDIDGSNITLTVGYM